MKNHRSTSHYFLCAALIWIGILAPGLSNGQFAELQIALKSLSPFEIFIDGEHYSAKKALSVAGIQPGFRHIKVTQRRGNGVNQTRTVVLFEGKVNLPKNTVTSVMVRENGKLKVRQTKVIKPSQQPGSRSIYA